MKKFLVMLLATCLATTMIACGGSKQTGSSDSASEPSTESESGDTAAEYDFEPIELKLGTTGPAPADDVFIASTYFADEIAAISDGMMTIEVIGSGALGTTAQHYAQLKEGSLDIFITAFDTATTMTGGDDFAVVACPYLFRDIDHYAAFLESDLLAEMIAPVEKDNNVHYVGPLGFRLPRGLNTTTPVAKADDVKNLKLRTPDTASTLRVWEALGANPQIIAASDLYTSLQSGLVDGQENDYMTSYNNGWMEAAHYYTEIDYIQQGNICLFSDSTWSALNDQQKAWVEEALASAHKKFNDEKQANAQAMKEQIIADGYEFVEDADLQSFRDKASEAVETLDGNLWSEGLVEKIKAIQ